MAATENEDRGLVDSEDSALAGRDSALAGQEGLVEDTALAGDGGAAGPGPESVNAGEDADLESAGPWLPDEEMRSMEERWRQIQAAFVDDPTRAIADADALVDDLMQRLTQMLNDERAALEARWAGRDGVSTEELRQGLHRYRSVFERLIVGAW